MNLEPHLKNKKMFSQKQIKSNFQRNYKTRHATFPFPLIIYIKEGKGLAWLRNIHKRSIVRQSVVPHETYGILSSRIIACIADSVRIKFTGFERSTLKFESKSVPSLWHKIIEISKSTHNVVI